MTDEPCCTHRDHERFCACPDHPMIDIHPFGWVCPECQNEGWVILLGTGDPSAPCGSRPAKAGDMHAVPCLVCAHGRRQPINQTGEPF